MTAPAIAVARVLGQNGFLAADEEARLLVERSGGDQGLLDALVARRLTGEPLAWIIGYTTFCDVNVVVQRGVYVPRWQTEAVARRAVERLPVEGLAIDVCTGCGAVAMTLASRRPRARMVATDIDPRAVACATDNGVDAHEGDIFAVPDEFLGATDVVVGVVPYVPTGELPLLQRDTFTFESRLAYDGGPDGIAILRRVIIESTRFLRRGGALLLELGGDQATLLSRQLTRNHFADLILIRDDDGDVRGLEATYLPPAARTRTADR